MEIQAFLPGVGTDELAAADLSDMCRLAAKARMVERLWSDIFQNAVSKALGGNK